MSTEPHSQLTPQQIHEALVQWLGSHRQPSEPLRMAIQRTVHERLFHESDVEFALNHLRDTVLDHQPESWLERVRLSTGNNPTRAEGVLCLHAGNLPLVGFQDILAVLLSRHSYAGKLSRKDPYLPASFVEVVRTLYPWVRAECTTNLRAYAGRRFRRWTFAGSETSLVAVQAQLLQQQIVDSDHKSLRRTAHFSAAMLSDWNAEVASNLVEAIFRYGGRGCRSVAMVYAPFTLAAATELLQNTAESWFTNNGIEQSSPDLVLFRDAYNRSVGISSLILGSHLIQEGTASPDFPAIVYWQEHQQAQAIRIHFGTNLQELYILDKTADNTHTVPVSLLRQAQRPPIDWKPDQADLLEWLLSFT